MLETDRLLLRPWRVEDAAVQRALWLDRLGGSQQQNRSPSPTVPAPAGGHRAQRPVLRGEEPSSLTVERTAVAVSRGGRWRAIATIAAMVACGADREER